MAKPKESALPRRARGQFCITLSRAGARLVEERIVKLGLSGPSEFFQTLVQQAVGARLSVVTDFDVVPVSRT